MNETCTWVQDGDDESWDTSCDNKFQFTDGGPADNDAKFCIYCGGVLVEVPYTPEVQL